MARGVSDLEQLVSEELSEPAPEAARHLADAIRGLHGASVAAVIFYGSCLRKRTDAGVLDFYAVVDSYREAYRSRTLAWVNSLLPPNVFYLEQAGATGTLRSKYAVISRVDFEAATEPTARRSGIWARFCQPTTAVYVRDDATRQLLARATSASIRTALQIGLPLLPGDDSPLEFGFDEFWLNTLRETYAAEMRPESPETIGSIYAAAPERFDRAARSGLADLADAGWLRWREADGRAVVELDAGIRRRAARAWRRRKPLRKAIYLVALLKSAGTFGDWLGYVLWKLERHSGTRIEVTERQRRHPLIWGWPVLWRVLRERTLR
jgi:hypothetical protein